MPSSANESSSCNSLNLASPEVYDDYDDTIFIPSDLAFAMNSLLAVIHDEASSLVGSQHSVQNKTELVVAHILNG